MLVTIAVRLKERIVHAIAPLRGDGRGWALVAIAVGWLLILGTRITIPVLLPGIKATFDIDNATAGFTITVIWAVYGLSQFPAGLLSNRIGDRKVLLASLAVMTLSIAALAAAPLFGVFLVTAALVGVGNGLYGPTRGTLLSSIYPDNDSAAIGFTLAVGSLGAAALPILAGAAVGRLGWRVTIACAVPLLFATTVLAWRVVPTTAIPAATESSPRRRFRGLLSAISRRRVVLGVGGKTIRVFVFQGLTAFLPTYLITVKGIDEVTASVLFATLFVSGAAAQVGGGRAVTRYGNRLVLVALAAVSVLPLLALPFLSGLVPITVVIVLAGIQLGIAPVTNTYIINALPPADRNGAWGLLRTGYFLIASTGSVFVGVLADEGYFDGAVLILGGLLAVVAIIFAFLPGLPREE
ncbi:MFS transporter [Halorussus sp. MSC15.2]|uniref:MFS transporter n=1 Tax=Halorussus sp. MSC15.2 TaxID=2283638 RepID=UPI0013CFD997|nr:MFS transporter [Halorussus sp. MSC15.2]NEU58686.1 MFS transporter [Halorussus sp. MSC15.2]